MPNKTLSRARHQLHLAGPDLASYELGEAMFIHDGGRLLGTVEPVEVCPGRSEVRISRFVPSPTLGREARNFAPLLLVEVTMFLAERFPTIQNVHFALAREMEQHGDGLMVAAARVELLRSIGATNVQARPKPDSSSPGNFVVEGVWSYTEDNVAALRMTLARERELYRRNLACASSKGSLASLLNRLKQWWGRDEDTLSPPHAFVNGAGGTTRGWRC